MDKKTVKSLAMFLVADLIGIAAGRFVNSPQRHSSVGKFPACEFALTDSDLNSKRK